MWMRFLVIEDGEVIERGNDKELMAEDSRYRFFQNLYAQANEWRVRGTCVNGWKNGLH